MISNKAQQNKAQQHSAEKYTKVAILLHWLIALLIFINISLAWTVDLLPDAYVRLNIDTHKSIGITVLGLVLLRILWRLGHPPPPLPSCISPLEKRAAHWGHISLYMLMITLPISGWMHDSAWKDAPTHPMQLFYLIPWPRIGLIEHIQPVFKETLHTYFGSLHEWLGIALYVFFILHILGTLKHRYVDQHSILYRILP